MKDKIDRRMRERLARVAPMYEGQHKSEVLAKLFILDEELEDERGNEGAK